MLFPASTGTGDPTFVTDRFGPVAPTRVVTVAELFARLGSVAEEPTEAVSVMTVPFAVPLFTFTTTVNVADVSPGMLELLQTTLPVVKVPLFGQLHPAGATRSEERRVGKE